MTPRTNPPKILGIATQGAGGGDEARLRALLGHLPAEFYPFERDAKFKSFRGLLSAIRRLRPNLVVMEGTGIAGGLAVLLSHWFAEVPYVVSSGDAIGPFVGAQMPWLRIPFDIYERLLFRNCSGFIGWTPYFVGRALTFSAPRAITAAGWAPFPVDMDNALTWRARIREELNIDSHTLVFGIAGSLAWSHRVGFCYGRELVEAIRDVERKDIAVLIVGGGDGYSRLERIAGDRIGKQVYLIGRVPRHEVPAYLAAMDVASLPQSVDQVGSFRYTTKLSEYLAAGLPIVTGQIPLAYDWPNDWLWRLPGLSPWDKIYTKALSTLMETISWESLERKRQAVPTQLREFDKHDQVCRVTEFLHDILLASRKDTS